MEQHLSSVTISHGRFGVCDLIPDELKIYSQLSSNEDHFSQVITAPIDTGKMYIIDKKDKTVGKSKELVSDTLKNMKKRKIINETPSKGGLLDYIQNYTIDKPEIIFPRMLR